MSIILSNLYDTTKGRYQLNRIAGGGGMSTPIRWVQFTEDIKTTDFFRGGELILTTGMSNDGAGWLLQFIQNLIHQKTCGLIINTGKYIRDSNITDAVIALCDAEDFPLFTMPWKIHLASIMQDYCNRIFMSTYTEDRTTMAFQQVLNHPLDREISLGILNDLGYDTHCPYLVMVARQGDSRVIPGDLLKAPLIPIAHRFPNDDYQVFILKDIPEDFQENLPGPVPGETHLGIGSRVNALTDLDKSYQHAILALKTAEYRSVTFRDYDRLGFFKLLFAIEDQTILTQAVHYRLGPLMVFDRENNTELTDTLRLFIQHDGSIQAVAEATFTHRNTINYRMKKIRNLLNIPSFSSGEKFELRMAFLIMDYLETVMTAGD